MALSDGRRLVTKGAGLLFAAGCSVAGGGAAAHHQPMHHHGRAAMEADLPEACGRASFPKGMEGMHAMMQDMMPHMGGHGRDMMQGMMGTEPHMMRGMMADDPDIAFACAMIPHHRGAVEMARAELEHGVSEAMKRMAQEIIDKQTKEIEELKRLIEEHDGK